MSLWDKLKDNLSEQGTSLSDIDGCDDSTFQEMLGDLGFTALERARLLTEWKRRRPSATMRLGSRESMLPPCREDSPSVVPTRLNHTDLPCAQHPHKSTELWCMDCEKLVCSSCIGEAPHNKHKWTSCCEAALQKKEVVDDWKARAAERYKFIQSLIKSLECVVEEILQKNSAAEEQIEASFEEMIKVLEYKKLAVLADLKESTNGERDMMQMCLDNCREMEERFKNIIVDLDELHGSGSELDILVAVERIQMFHSFSIEIPSYTVPTVDVPTKEHLLAFFAESLVRTKPGSVLYPRVLEFSPQVSVKPLHLRWDPMWKSSLVQVTDPGVAKSIGECGKRHHIRSAEPFPAGRHYFEMKFSSEHEHCASLCGLVSSGFSMLDDTDGHRNAWVVPLRDIQQKIGSTQVGIVIDTILHNFYVFADELLFGTYPISTMGPFYAYASVCCSGASVRIIPVMEVPYYVSSVYDVSPVS